MSWEHRPSFIYSQSILEHYFRIMYKYCYGTNLLINVLAIRLYRYDINFNTDPQIDLGLFRALKSIS